MDVHAAIDQLTHATDALDNFDYTHMSPADRRQLITALHHIERRLTGHRLTATAAHDRQVAWKSDGYRSAKEWLADELNLDRRQAAATAAITRRLADLPRTADGLRSGQLGIEEARDITRAADTASSGQVDQLDELVQATAAEGANATQVRDVVTAWTARTLDAERDAEARLWRDRRGWIGRNGTGAVTLTATLDPVGGETVLSAITPLTVPASAEDERTHGQRVVDAVVELARIALEGARLPDHGGTRPTVAVHVPVEALAAGSGEARLAHYGPATATSAQIVGCDANVQRVVMDPRGQPLDVGRKRRLPTAAQRLAVTARDRCCIGCGSSRGGVIHHIIYWTDDGPTDLHNLCLLCWSCHNSLHRFGWTIRQRPDGRYYVDRSTGRHIT